MQDGLYPANNLKLLSVTSQDDSHSIAHFANSSPNLLDTFSALLNIAANAATIYATNFGDMLDPSDLDAAAVDLELTEDDRLFINHMVFRVKVVDALMRNNTELLLVYEATSSAADETDLESVDYSNNFTLQQHSPFLTTQLVYNCHIGMTTCFGDDSVAAPFSSKQIGEAIDAIIKHETNRRYRGQMRQNILATRGDQNCGLNEAEANEVIQRVMETFDKKGSEIFKDMIDGVKPYLEGIDKKRFIYLMKPGKSDDQRRSAAFDRLLELLRKHASDTQSPLVLDCTDDEVLKRTFESKYGFQQLLAKDYNWTPNRKHYIMIYDPKQN